MKKCFKKSILFLLVLVGMLLVNAPSSAYAAINDRISFMVIDDGGGGGGGSYESGIELGTTVNTAYYPREYVVKQMMLRWPSQYPIGYGENRAYDDLYGSFYKVYGQVPIPKYFLDEYILKYDTYWEGFNKFRDSQRMLRDDSYGKAGLVEVPPPKAPTYVGILDTQNDKGLYTRVENGYIINHTGDINKSSLNENKGPGSLEKNLAEFLVDFVESFQQTLENVGMTVDTAIYGRVNGNGVKFGNLVVAPFTFELEGGNVYGIVGAAVYSTVVKYAFVFMALLSFFILCAQVFKRGRDGFGELWQILKKSGLAFLLAMTMPYLFEITLYIRDILLQGILGGVIKLTGSTGTSLVGTFQALATTNKSFFNATLYALAVIVSFVYCCIYIGIALELLIYFITFPVMCVKGVTDTGAYKDWCSKVFGNLVIPIADGILYIVPCLFAKYAADVPADPKGGASPAAISYSFIALIILILITTIRKSFFEALGLKTGSMGDAVQSLGRSALHIGAGFAMGVSKVGKTALETGQAVQSGIVEGNTYGKLAKMEEEQNAAASASRTEPVPSNPSVGGSPEDNIASAGSTAAANAAGRGIDVGSTATSASDEPIDSASGAGAAAMASPIRSSGGRMSTDSIAHVMNSDVRDVSAGLSYKKKQKLAYQRAVRDGLKGLGKTAGQAAFGVAGAYAGAVLGAGLGGERGLEKGFDEGTKVADATQEDVQKVYDSLMDVPFSFAHGSKKDKKVKPHASGDVQPTSVIPTPPTPSTYSGEVVKDAGSDVTVDRLSSHADVATAQGVMASRSADWLDKVRTGTVYQNSQQEIKRRNEQLAYEGKPLMSRDSENIIYARELSKLASDYGQASFKHRVSNDEKLKSVVSGNDTKQHIEYAQNLHSTIAKDVQNSTADLAKDDFERIRAEIDAKYKDFNRTT